MTRATGILVGTLLMLGFFLLVLGSGHSPTLERQDAGSKVEPRHADTGPVPEKQLPVEKAADSAAVLAEDTVTNPAGHAGPSMPDAGDDEFVLDAQLWNQSVDAQEAGYRDDAAVSHYRVWSPFRSEWAANGFARRLVLATEVPVEVVNESPGKYQVVFSYRDDTERQAMVERIESITGLELE